MEAPMLATIIFLNVLGVVGILYARKHSKKDENTDNK